MANKNKQKDFSSVVTDNQPAQATVTTGAVGESKIPDRLYRKMIRKRIDSFV